jgi:hypothetical protein
MYATNWGFLSLFEIGYCFSECICRNFKRRHRVFYFDAGLSGTVIEDTPICQVISTHDFLKRNLARARELNSTSFYPSTRVISFTDIYTTSAVHGPRRRCWMQTLFVSELFSTLVFITGDILGIIFIHSFPRVSCSHIGAISSFRSRVAA